MKIATLVLNFLVLLLRATAIPVAHAMPDTQVHTADRVLRVWQACTKILWATLLVSTVMLERTRGMGPAIARLVPKIRCLLSGAPLLQTVNAMLGTLVQTVSHALPVMRAHTQEWGPAIVRRVRLTRGRLMPVTPQPIANAMLATRVRTARYARHANRASTKMHQVALFARIAPRIQHRLKTAPQLCIVDVSLVRQVQTDTSVM